MPKLWMGVSPGAEVTRVIALQDNETILKAHLASAPSHPCALQWLLEAVALWQGTAVRAVLSAGSGDAGPAASFLSGLVRRLRRSAVQHRVGHGAARSRPPP